MKMTETSQDRYLSAVCSLPLVFRDEHAEVWMWPIFLERNMRPPAVLLSQKEGSMADSQCMTGPQCVTDPPCPCSPSLHKGKISSHNCDDSKWGKRHPRPRTEVHVEGCSTAQSAAVSPDLFSPSLPFKWFLFLHYHPTSHTEESYTYIYRWFTLLSPITFLKQEYLSDSESHGATETSREILCREQKGQHLAAQEEGSQASGFGLYGQISWHSALKSGYQQNRPGHGSR